MESENRKILLDQSVYCPNSGWSEGGDSNCNHDYDPKPLVEHDEYTKWQCTKCGLVRGYEVWD